MRLIYTLSVLLLGIAIGSFWFYPAKIADHGRVQLSDSKPNMETHHVTPSHELEPEKPAPTHKATVLTALLSDQSISENTQQPDSVASNIIIESVPLPLTPWQELMGLADDKKWSELIIYHDHNTFGPDAHAASQWRAKALLENIISQGNLLSFQQTNDLLQEQLLLTPAHSGVHLSLAKAEFKQGLVQQALDTLEQGANLSQDNDNASALLSHRDVMVQEHIDFLLENEYWQEVITFVRSEPASASPHYYAHQLAAAHAHVQLFQWEEAKSLLNMAEFDPTLYTAIAQLRNAIQKGEDHMLLKRQELARKNLIEQQILGNTNVENREFMSLPFEKEGNAILVPFFIGKQRLRLLFDTGASITMISKSWIEKSKSQHLAQLDTKTFITAGGRVQSPMIRVQDVRFGPLTFKHVDIAFQDIFDPSSGIDGLLGMNVLKYYEIKFDFDASTLLLRTKY